MILKNLLTSPNAPLPITLRASKSSTPNLDLLRRRNSVSFCACCCRFSCFWSSESPSSFILSSSLSCLWKKAQSVLLHNSTKNLTLKISYSTVYIIYSKQPVIQLPDNQLVELSDFSNISQDWLIFSYSKFEVHDCHQRRCIHCLHLLLMIDR